MSSTPNLPICDWEKTAKTEKTRKGIKQDALGQWPRRHCVHTLPAMICLAMRFCLDIRASAFRYFTDEAGRVGGTGSPRSRIPDYSIIHQANAWDYNPPTSDSWLYLDASLLGHMTLRLIVRVYYSKPISKKLRLMRRTSSWQIVLPGFQRHAKCSVVVRSEDAVAVHSAACSPSQCCNRSLAGIIVQDTVIYREKQKFNVESCNVIQKPGIYAVQCRSRMLNPNLTSPLFLLQTFEPSLGYYGWIEPLERYLGGIVLRTKFIRLSLIQGNFLVVYPYVFAIWSGLEVPRLARGQNLLGTALLLSSCPSILGGSCLWSYSIGSSYTISCGLA